MHEESLNFESSREAALAQIDAVQPAAYAKTRNFLDGKVTRLSPWLTHGWTDTLEVARRLFEKHSLGFDHKLIFELGWREFFKHVHMHLGNGILGDIREPLHNQYSNELPLDIRHACTGVHAIDAGVKELYKTGYLHNHVRMWIASYVVHIRNVHWRTGADWMIAHLLDGDLASNHLSWQWVAGTFSSKPYLFNAANVKKYAPYWGCPETVIDTDYGTLNEMAASPQDFGPEAKRPKTETPEPECFGLEGLDVGLPRIDLTLNQPPPIDIDKPVVLVHPWNLRACTQEGQIKIGLIDDQFHSQFKWSAKRWQFVNRALSNCDAILVADGSSPKAVYEWLSLLGQPVHTIENLNPGYEAFTAAGGLNENLHIAPLSTILPALADDFCRSFSKFYKKGCKLAGRFDEAIA